MKNQSLVAVIGPSGSGKSSVVFAGLIPVLREEGNWLIESFRPWNQPFYGLASALVRQLEPEVGKTEQAIKAGELEKALREGNAKLQHLVSEIVERTPAKLLLVADQFEELYTQSPELERQVFLDALLSACSCSQTFTCVLTLRADFYEYALSYRPFSDALQGAILNLGPMNQEELLAAIEKPAEKLKVGFEKNLIQRILDDVGSEPGNLPLLEFALKKLWSKQEKEELTHRAYEEIGRVEKALATHAETVYNELNSIEQKQAQRIFMQLVHPGEGTQDTRQLATRAAMGPENWNLITEHLAGEKARLVVTGRNSATGEETVEIVHDALIRHWSLLRQWVDENRDALKKKQSIEKDAEDWKESGKLKDYLLQGLKLAEVKNFQEHYEADLPLSLTAQEFVQKSILRRRNNRLLLRSSVAGLILFLIIFAALMFKQYSNAQLKADSANARAILELEGLIASVKVGKELRKWKKFRIIAELDTQMQVVKELQQAVYGVKEKNRLTGHDDEVNSVSFSPDGQIIASASSDNTVKLWKSNGSLIATLKRHKAKVYAVSFSPDGQMVASASADNTVKLWRRDGRFIRNLSGHNATVWGVSFSPDGQIIASASADKTVKLWKSDGSLIKTLTGHSAEVYAVRFSPDGQMLASASADKTVKLWRGNATGGFQTHPYKTLLEHSDKVYDVSFSPDGQTIASASQDKTVKLWNRNGDLKRVWSKVVARKG